ncbi:MULTISPECIES: endonuclease V [unclassified Kribbella]|uniref:endonuclease V n=1 Tax=unclassified Kribbella TaxID=2644121 RepID=UPI003016918D
MSLISLQHALAQATPPRWTPPERFLAGGAWICLPRGLSGPGSAGDHAWAAAVVMDGRRVVGRSSITGRTAAPYVPGLLALRLAPLFEDVVRRLRPQPEVLLLDATGRDHPRRAGLATQLGAVLDLPTVGVTHRPLTACGDWPADEAGATAPLTVDAEQVATWLRTKPGTRPLVVHPGWRTDLGTAVQVVQASLAGRRTPEPLRQARQMARRARGSEDL